MLHVGYTEHDGDAVTLFTKQTWETAGDIAQARIQYQKRSKYLVICESINFKAEPLPHYGFHSDCYSKFTAYQIQSKEKKRFSDEGGTVETRAMVETPPAPITSTTGVVKKMCIFCKGPDRKHFPSGFETLSPCETIQAQDSILNAARQLNDKEFLREYEHIDFIAKEVNYHKTCRARYIAKGTKVQIKEKGSMYTHRRESAFLSLISYIDSKIFLKEISMKLVDINQTYIEFLYL